MSITYTAEVTREGRWWMVSVPEIDGLTQARRLSEAEGMARDLVAVTLDVPVEDVTVSVRVSSVDGVDVAGEMAAIRAGREEAARLDRDATERTRALARDLVARDVPLRDVGAVLGVSHQRAHQLASN